MAGFPASLELRRGLVRLNSLYLVLRVLWSNLDSERRRLTCSGDVGRVGCVGVAGRVKSGGVTSVKSASSLFGVGRGGGGGNRAVTCSSDGECSGAGDEGGSCNAGNEGGRGAEGDVARSTLHDCDDMAGNVGDAPSSWAARIEAPDKPPGAALLARPDTSSPGPGWSATACDPT